MPTPDLALLMPCHKLDKGSKGSLFEQTNYDIRITLCFEYNKITMKSSSGIN